MAQVCCAQQANTKEVHFHEGHAQLVIELNSLPLSCSEQNISAVFCFWIWQNSYVLDVALLQQFVFFFKNI